MIVPISNKYTGNGTTSNPITGIGYRPASVWIRREASIGTLYVSIDVSGTVYTKPSGSNVAVTTTVSFTSDGFTLITTNTDLNETGVSYFFIAFPRDTSICDTFTYVGDGTDNRSVGSLSFTPDLAFCMPLTSARGPYWTSTKHSADSSQPLTNGAAAAANFIQSLVSGGIQVGTSLNTNLTNYYVLCFLNVSQMLSQTGYTGDGVDDRNVAHGLGVSPGLVLTQSRSGTAQNAVLRFLAQTGDISVAAGDTVNLTTNAIQSLDTANVNLGTNSAVNGSGRSFSMMTWQAVLVTPPVVVVIPPTDSNGGSTAELPAPSTGYGSIDTNPDDSVAESDQTLDSNPSDDKLLDSNPSDDAGLNA